MTNQRTHILALLTTALLAMGTATAQAQETVRIAVPDGANVSEDAEQIILFGQETGTRSFNVDCMVNNGFDGDDHIIQSAIALDTAIKPKATLVDEAYLEFDLPPGTRLVDLILLSDNCSIDGIDYDVFSAEIASPQDGDALVVMTSSDSLTENHEAVIKAGADAYGISDGVCVTKGEKPQHTELIADIHLYAGDRLIDFVEVDHDPETGETWYACWLEY